MKLWWSREWPVAGLLGLMAAVSLVMRPVLPETVPTHYGLGLKADDWGPRIVLLVLVPAVAVVIQLLFPFLGRLDPDRGRPGWDAQQRRGRIAMMVVFAVLHAALLVVTWQRWSPLPLILGLPPLTLAILAYARVLTPPREAS